MGILPPAPGSRWWDRDVRTRLTSLPCRYGELWLCLSYRKIEMTDWSSRCAILPYLVHLHQRVRVINHA